MKVRRCCDGDDDDGVGGMVMTMISVVVLAVAVGGDGGVDPEVGSVFGLAGKIPPEKFSGGGGGRRHPGEV
ncbi:hypothetical protein Tco_0654236 [Tanacetum coccineum]|uniref:Glycine-rich protein n=1 Tax=Tanacetum coccineum TaxID=301880 RepID=A0ABQ4X2W5_9ASTR